MEQPQGHSPLGASGTHRWMPCSGSVGLSYGIDDPESDYAAIGTAAHLLGEMCLHHSYDAWHYIGLAHYKGPAITPLQPALYDIASFDNKKLAETIRTDGIVIDKPMADAVQIYLDAVKVWHPDRNQGNTWIERRFHCPTIHKYFYGTSDLVHWDEAELTLHIWDYKNGAGIVVDVPHNPQLMYYACGALEDLDLWQRAKKVVLHVAQPNGFHWNGPIRHWETTPNELAVWLEDVLVPAMDNALVSRETKSGEHCRFCPARGRACPQIIADLTELEKIMLELEGKQAKEIDNATLARFADLFDVAKIAAKAQGEEIFKRLNGGGKIPGRKLAKARSNREWKPDAEKAILAEFGDAAMTKPELKSPAQIEALPKGEAAAARWAFKPDKGLTVVKDDDARPAVSKDTKSLFKDETKSKAKKRA